MCVLLECLNFMQFHNKFSYIATWLIIGIWRYQLLIFIFTSLYFSYSMIYHLAWIFGRENHGEFGESLVCHQILTKFRDIYKESKQAGIHQSFTCWKFLMRNLPKFFSPKSFAILALIKYQEFIIYIVIIV